MAATIRPARPIAVFLKLGSFIDPFRVRASGIFATNDLGRFAPSDGESVHGHAPFNFVYIHKCFRFRRETGVGGGALLLAGFQFARRRGATKREKNQRAESDGESGIDEIVFHAPRDVSSNIWLTIQLK